MQASGASVWTERSALKFRVQIEVSVGMSHAGNVEPQVVRDAKSYEQIGDAQEALCSLTMAELEKRQDELRLSSAKLKLLKDTMQEELGPGGQDKTRLTREERLALILHVVMGHVGGSDLLCDKDEQQRRLDAPLIKFLINYRRGEAVAAGASSA